MTISIFLLIYNSSTVCVLKNGKIGKLSRNIRTFLIFYVNFPNFLEAFCFGYMKYDTFLYLLPAYRAGAKMVDFDEKSGVIWSSTEWGSWGQTIEEIFIKVNLPENTTSKQVVCKITAKSIKCVVRGNVIFEVHVGKSSDRQYRN